MMAMIWVKAIEMGFDGMQRRRQDARFQVEEKQFSARWMKKIKPPREDDEELEPEEKLKQKPGRQNDKSPI